MAAVGIVGTVFGAKPLAAAFGLGAGGAVLVPFLFLNAALYMLVRYLNVLLRLENNVAAYTAETLWMQACLNLLFLLPGFFTRKVELLRSMTTPADPADRVEPIGPAEYNAIREQVLSGLPSVSYGEPLIRYQEGLGKRSGGGLYRIAIGTFQGCAAAEYVDEESVVFKELLLPPEHMPRGLAALAAKLPGQRCFVRTPAQWDGMQGSYLQPFGMIKWYNQEKGAQWGEETQGYMGLGFD